MESINNIIDDYRYMRKVNFQRSFGLDYKEEQTAAKAIERKLTDFKLQQLNDEFIEMHKWKDDYFSIVYVWDIVIHENQVCRIKDIYRTFYDEGKDIFNYAVELKGLFMENELTVKFDYYYTGRILI